MIASTIGLRRREFRMNGPGQTSLRAIRAVAAGAALLLNALTPAHPASIERRPDGTLLVKAQGEHFVFSERDERRISFLGPKLRLCAENYDFRDPNPFKDLYGSLARWLHDPQLAPCFDSLVPTDSVADKTEFFSTSPLRATIASYIPASSSPAFPARTRRFGSKASALSSTRRPSRGCPGPASNSHPTYPLKPTSIAARRFGWASAIASIFILSSTRFQPSGGLIVPRRRFACHATSSLSGRALSGYFRPIGVFGSRQSGAREPGSPIRTG
jgi:hypothetical protein